MLNRRELLSAAPLGLAAFTLPGLPSKATAPIEFPACCPVADLADTTTHSDLPARVYLCTACGRRVWAARLDEDGIA